MTQEQILMTLVQGEDGRVWASDRLGWSLEEQPPVPVCDWKGVTCENGATVTHVDLAETDYLGTLPAALGQLSTLKSFSLKQNIVQGAIPQEFADLPNLEDVDLSNNRISGSLPKFRSGALSRFILGGNMLTGSIPADFGDGHPKLKEIDVIRNQLTGSLPHSLGKLTGLNKLSLSENKLYGTIPDNLGNLPSLEFFYIDLNEFVGTVPRSLTPPNSPLKEVWFQGNLLSGTVPVAFAEMKNLVNLYVDGNKFTGQLPEDLCKPEINNDFYQGQTTGGDTPESERDFCASIACPVGEVSLEGVWPCTACEAGTYSPYLGREVSCLPRDESAILHKLWLATNGNEWTRSNNWYYDGVDICDFTGITCNEAMEVSAIALPNFNLRGTIPEELGFLEHLVKLDLSNNQLYGYLPSDLRFAPLDLLDVSGNQLVGMVPPMLCLAGEVNGNGLNGDYNCDSIACPAGTFCPAGRAGEGHSCQPCPDGVPYLGRRECRGKVKMSGEEPGMTVSGKALLSVFFVTVALVSAVLGYMYYVRRRRRAPRSLDDMAEFTVSDHLDVEGKKMPPPSDPLYMGTFPDSVEVEEMHDDFSSITRVRKKKGKKKKDGKKKKVSPKYDQVVTEEGDEEDSESASSNPVWLDVPKLESPRSQSPPSIT